MKGSETVPTSQKREVRTCEENVYLTSGPAETADWVKDNWLKGAPVCVSQSVCVWFQNNLVNLYFLWLIFMKKKTCVLDNGVISKLRFN